MSDMQSFVGLKQHLNIFGRIGPHLEGQQVEIMSYFPLI